MSLPVCLVSSSAYSAKVHAEFVSLVLMTLASEHGHGRGSIVCPGSRGDAAGTGGLGDGPILQNGC